MNSITSSGSGSFEYYEIEYIYPLYYLLIPLSPLILVLVLFLLLITYIIYKEIKNAIYIKYNKLKTYLNTHNNIKNNKLTNTFIKKLNDNYKKDVHKPYKCSICIDEINNKHNIVFLKCGHAYHKQCLNNWVKTKVKNTQDPDCPMCRDVIIEIPKIISYDSDVSSHNSDYD